MASEKNKKKVLDKSYKMCYNKDVKEKRMATEKPLKKIKKVLDNFIKM